MTCDWRRGGGARASLALALLLAACAPAAPSQSSVLTPQPSQPKTLTIGLENEPEFLAPGFGDTSGNKAASNLRMALSQRLATYDDRGDLLPQLAADLPTQDKGTWLLGPDGTMQTTYRLRPNVTWHDGAPFTARDVVFGWTVMADEGLGQSPPQAARLVGRMDILDDLAFAIHWIRPYPFANAIVGDELGPLPAHILASAYQSDKERFLQLPYFSRELVGLGPYQLVDWERGSHLVLKAYDHFYAGRAKIDTLIVRFIPNPPTAVANLLAGAVDGILPRTLDFSQAMFVRGEWEQAGKRPVALAQPTHWRMLFVQHRDPRPREILDVRVRQGVLHALDRKAMVDALLAGQSPVSDTFLPPDDAKWDWVKDVVTRYDYDPGRAQVLFAAAGWRRATDGSVVGAGGERVTIPLWTTSGAQYEQEQAILGDSLRALGFGVEQHVLTPAQDRDRQFRASFPALDGSQIPVKLDTVLARLYGPNCPTQESRWAGNNRGCWQDAAMDRINDGLGTAVDPTEQRRLYGELVKSLTEKLPVLPLYFSVQVVLFREGVTGVKGDTRPSGSETWNVAEWDVR